MKYIAKIDTIINYKCFNAGDDVPEAFVTERLIDIGVIERIVEDTPDTPKIGTGAKPKKTSKKILTEDSSDVETTVETTDKE